MIKPDYDLCYIPRISDTFGKILKRGGVGPFDLCGGHFDLCDGLSVFLEFLGRLKILDFFNIFV